MGNQLDVEVVFWGQLFCKGAGIPEVNAELSVHRQEESCSQRFPSNIPFCWSYQLPGVIQGWVMTLLRVRI